MSDCSWCAGSRRDPVMGAGPCRGCDGEGSEMKVQWALLIGLVAFLIFVLIFGFLATNL